MVGQLCACVHRSPRVDSITFEKTTFDVDSWQDGHRSVSGHRRVAKVVGVISSEGFYSLKFK